MKEIKLTQGKFALVDDEDFDELNKYKWCVNNYGYPIRQSPKLNGKQHAIFMHRIIMNTSAGMYTDHKDQNKLNNQRSNLRVCTKSQNGMNREKHAASSSSYKGVSIVMKHHKPIYYRTRIKVNGKYISKIFPFSSDGELAAANWYNELAKQHFGEFVHLNVIPEH